MHSPHTRDAGTGHPIPSRLSTARHGINSITGFRVPKQSGKCDRAIHFVQKRVGMYNEVFEIAWLWLIIAKQRTHAAAACRPTGGKM
jgi:hypothetical protein